MSGASVNQRESLEMSSAMGKKASEGLKRVVWGGEEYSLPTADQSCPFKYFSPIHFILRIEVSDLVSVNTSSIPMNIEQWIWSKMKIPPKMVEFKNITYEYGQRWIERMPSIQFLSISSATYWQVSLAVTRIRSHIFDFYFELQTAASDISNQHEMSHHNLVMMMQDLNSPKGFTPVWCPLFVQLIWKSASFAK